MTIGQRIAQKRKERNLSQEALGEQLGVSRQAIYKWESDAALPEIDKLIALSRLFGVPVGWLLGVEEPSPAEAEVAEEASELTEQQLKMVQEIAERYIAAQPKPDTQRQRRFFRRGAVVFAALFCACFFAIFSLFQRLDRMNRQYDSLQYSVNNVTWSVNSQINGISHRVEEILKQQNNLTAEYGAEHLSDDYASNTALFSVWAVPKTYVDGMSASFVADNGKKPVEIPAKELPERKFTVEIATELTDMISLSVVFTYPDGTMHTQLLNSFEQLYSSSLPSIDLQDNLMDVPLSDGKLVFPLPDGAEYWEYVEFDSSNAHNEIIADIRIGLFKNQQLMAWAEPCKIPDHYIGFDGHNFFRFPAVEIPLTDGDELRCGAIVTDIYGRSTVSPGMVYIVDETRSALTWADNQIWDTDPANWHY